MKIQKGILDAGYLILACCRVLPAPMVAQAQVRRELQRQAKNDNRASSPRSCFRKKARGCWPLAPAVTRVQAVLLVQHQKRPSPAPIRRARNLNWSCAIGLGLLWCWIIAGCHMANGKSQIAPVPAPPQVQAKSDKRFAISNLPGYASRAIKATGGLDRWVKTKKIELDAVVTFYQLDGSFYLTQQHHEIWPWSNSIRISATEPQGKFVWQLSNGSFSVQHQKRLNKALLVLDQRYFAEAMLNITTAPIRFLDSEVVWTSMPDPVKKEGLWYYSIERAPVLSCESKNGGSKVVFYANSESSLVDMLWFVPGEAVETDEGKFVAVRGYDYRTCACDTAGAGKIEKNAVCVPTKIEIFRTNAGGIFQQRMVEIDVYRLKSVE